MKNAEKTLKKQYKRQNEYIKQNYDRLSITLPRGCKATIADHIGSVNGYVSELILTDLRRRGLWQTEEDARPGKQEDDTRMQGSARETGR